MIKAVFFDIGSTLYQDHNASLRAAKRVSEYLSSIGYHHDVNHLWQLFCRSREAIRYFGGNDFEPWDLSSLTMLLSSIGIRDPEIVLNAYKEFVEGITEGLVLEDDAVDVLEYLKSRGYALAIVSNMGSYDIVLRILSRDKILKYFNAIVASQMVGWRKPSSKIYEYTLRLLGLNPREAVHVGDDPIADVFGAKKVGLKVIHKPRPDTPPSPLADAIIIRLSDLKEIIEVL